MNVGKVKEGYGLQPPSSTLGAKNTKKFAV